MDKNILSRMEDLQVELGCTVDSLSMIQMFVAEQTDNRIIGDGLFGLCRHFERLADELDEIVNDEYKLRRGENDVK